MRCYTASVPAIAYFITIRTYGTWLRGDERGWIDLHHSRYGSPYGEPDALLEATHQARMKHPPVTLNRKSRQIVHEALIDVCNHINHRLHEKSVRTQHCHIVLAAHPNGSRAAPAPEKLVGILKSRATRLLADASLYPRGARIWADQGSTRHLFTPEDIEIAARYVRDGQGEDLD